MASTPVHVLARAGPFLTRDSESYGSYDTSLDGKRFLMIQRDPGSVPRQLNVILNWADER